MPRVNQQKTNLVPRSLYSRIRGYFAAGIIPLILACAFFQPQITATPIPTANNTSLPQSTNTPEMLPTIAFSNYLKFAPTNHWEVPNIVKITGIAFSPDKQYIALFTLRYPEQWWLELRDSQNGELLWNVNVGKAAYNALAFSPDGKLIGTGTEEGDVRIWDVTNGSLVHTLEGHIYPVRYVAFSPDGTMIASGASDNTARVWQVSNGMNLSVYKIKTDVRDIAWSPDSQNLAVTSNYVNVYNIPSHNNHPVVYYDNVGDTRDLGEVAFSPNSIFLIGAGEWLNPENSRWRYRILVWDFPYNETAPLRIPLDDAIEDVVISPDGQVLVAVYKDKGKLLLIDIVDREIKGNIDIGPKLYMSYSPDISTFAVVSTKTTVTIWGIPR
ncbi:MAG: WD40 repeat domain-containing protein [Chloroflexota bacterium]